MNSFGRLAIGLGTIGSAVGGGYALHRQLSTESISKKLLANGYKLLDEKSDEWTKILASYKATISSKEELKFEGFTGEPSSESILKEKCNEALKAPSSDEKNYKKAEHWCTSPRTLTDVLKKEGYRALGTKDDDDNIDQANWDKKIDEHNKKNENQGKRFENINSKDTVEKNTAGRKEIKAKCKELKGKKHYEQDFSANLEKAKLWCAIEDKQQTSIQK